MNRLLGLDEEGYNSERNLFIKVHRADDHLSA